MRQDDSIWAALLYVLPSVVLVVLLIVLAACALTFAVGTLLSLLF